MFPPGNSEPGAHPFVGPQGLFVRGKLVATFDKEHDAIERLALWGVAFTISAEKLTYNRCRHTATLLACFVLTTDRLVGVKVMPKLAALLKELE